MIFNGVVLKTKSIKFVAISRLYYQQIAL